MIEVEMTWVVETGMPNVEAPWMMSAAVVSAAKPCTGCSLTILCPIVRMIRQPPAVVPAAMVRAHAIMTQ